MKRTNEGELNYISKVRIIRIQGPTRRAYLEGFSDPIIFGVHGAIKRFYQVEPEEEHPTTLDHMVAAIAA